MSPFFGAKHARDAYALGRLLNRPVPTVADDALVEDVYGIDADLSCRRCELSVDPRFPLAPKDRIFELLGWTKQPSVVAAAPLVGGTDRA